MTPMKISRKARSGFTLIAILAVITLLVLLAGVVVPHVFSYVKTGRISATTLMITSVEEGLNQFNMEC